MLWASCRAFPAFTLKRKIFKGATLLWAAVLWLARRVRVPAGTALDSAEAKAIARIQDACPQMAAAMVLWSLVPGRQRTYFRIFDAKATECAFGKLSCAEPGRGWLQVEAAALERYAMAQSFTCPQVLMLDVTERETLLLTSAFPAGTTLLHAQNSDFPRPVQVEIQDKRVEAPFASLRDRAWFRRGREALAKNAGVSAALDAMDDAAPVTLAPAHWDFGSENFFTDPQGGLLLIDWEHHDPEAPILTDEVGFWIGRHHRAIQRHQHGIAADFSAAFEGQTESDLLLALLYLSGYEIGDAQTLVSLWKN